MENRPWTLKEAEKLEKEQPLGTFLVFAPLDPFEEESVYLKVQPNRWEVYLGDSRLQYSSISVMYWMCDVDTWGIWSFS